MAHQKILFVVNPVSGDRDKTILLNLLKDKSREHGNSFSYYMTTGTDDAIKIKSEIKRLKPSTVVAVGGDGTVRLVASLLLNEDILLGIIPLGSANGLALELSLPTEVPDSLDLILSKRATEIDAITINDNAHSFHLSDLGINSLIIKGYTEEKQRGLWGYARSFIKESKNIKSFHCTVKSDQKEIRHKAVMVVIANGSHYGTGASINPTGSLDDGKFEVILVKPETWWRILKLSVASFTRSIRNHESTIVISCKQAEISIHPGQFLQIDGELLKKTNHVSAKIIPGAIKVITG